MALGGITLSQGLRTNLLSLQGLQENISGTQNRLSTGKRINSPIDGALNYFQSQGLADRAKAFKELNDSIGLGLSTINTASKNLDRVKDLLESAAGQLRNALSAGGTNAKLTSGFNFTSLSADFAPAAGAVNQFDDGDAIKLSLLNPSGAAATNVSITVAGKTVGQLIDQINGDTTLNPAGAPRVRAYLSDGTSGSLVIEVAESNASSTALVGAGNAVGLQIDLVDAAPTTNDLRSVFNFSGIGTGALGVSTATQVQVFGTNNATRTAAFSAYQTTLEQVNKFAVDAGFNGVNLLQGDSLTTYFNSDNTTFLRTQGSFLSATNLGFNVDNSKGTVSTGGSFDGTQTALSRGFQSDAEIRSSLTNLKRGNTSVVALNQTLSANLNILKARQTYTSNYVTIHDHASDDLVVADINQEGANLLALQTRQQLAVQALSLAGQSDQAVLRLF